MCLSFLLRPCGGTESVTLLLTCVFLVEAFVLASTHLPTGSGHPSHSGARGLFYGTLPLLCPDLVACGLRLR